MVPIETTSADIEITQKLGLVCLEKFVNNFQQKPMQPKET